MMSSSGFTTAAIMAALLLCPAAGAFPKASGAVRAQQQAATAAVVLHSSMQHIVPASSYIWNWRDAVLLKSFTDIYRSCGSDSLKSEIAAYTLSAMERLAPKAHGTHPNGIASGVGLAFLQEIGMNTAASDNAAQKVYSQYLKIPRSPEGACSHRGNVVELWDDTLYMLDIFLLGMYRASGERKYLDAFRDEVLSHAVRLQDPQTGLWYHGWALSGEPTGDRMCERGWNVNPLHRSSEFWGRGNGWVAMAIADLLEVLEKEDPGRSRILGMYRRMMRTLKPLQDRQTGLWRQLPLYGDVPGNFPESSCTAMIGYAMAKGANLGILPGSYLRSAEKAFEGLCRHCLELEGTPAVTVSGVCEGTCIGGKDYYLSRKTGNRETYADGAFLLLANQLQLFK